MGLGLGRMGRYDTFDAVFRNKESLQLLDEVAPVLVAVGRERDTKRQCRSQDVVTGADTEADQMAVAGGLAADLDPAAQTVDAKHKPHRRIIVGVDKSVRA